LLPKIRVPRDISLVRDLIRVELYNLKFSKLSQMICVVLGLYSHVKVTQVPGDRDYLYRLDPTE
jgi:hypothetical protein